MNEHDICTNKSMNEFSYSEDTQMALKDALYANEFSFEGVKTVVVSGTMTLIFVPWLATVAPNSQTYAVKNLPLTEQRDVQFNAEELEQVNNPVIEQAEAIEVSPYDEVLTFLKNLKTLPKNYQDIDFEIPSEVIIDNAQKFLLSMQKANLPCPDDGCVMPSVFGTIVIDVMVERGLVSMEIGRTKVGFFTDYEDGINEESDGISTDFNTIPEPLLKHLIA